VVTPGVVLIGDKRSGKDPGEREFQIGQQRCGEDAVSFERKLADALIRAAGEAVYLDGIGAVLTPAKQA
jgi:hypothetical protein